MFKGDCMKRFIGIYRELFAIIRESSRYLVLLCVFLAVISGLLSGLFVWVNGKVFNLGIDVAEGVIEFRDYVPYLILFVITAIVPIIIGMILITYIQPNSQLIFRTSYRGKLIQKLSRLKYEHFENSESVEIIDKAFSRSEEAALHLFPKYIFTAVSAFVAIVGILYLFISIRWWFLLTIMLPFILDTYISYRNNFNIYNEMETYWNRERRYWILSNIMKSRTHMMETKLFNSSDYLVDTYEKRLKSRNKEYEKFYFLYLRKHFLEQNILKISQLINVVLLLWVYLSGAISIGQLIALSAAVFQTLWVSLSNLAGIFKWSGQHLNSFEYYDQFFKLTECEYGDRTEIPQEMSIDFNGVNFLYPGTDKVVLSDLDFQIKNGENVAIVGENGEGKTTLIKLLLGLYEPTSGQILVGGHPISEYSKVAREKIFGTVFQDFGKYSITIKENIGIGCQEQMDDMTQLKDAIKKGKVDSFVNELPKGIDSLLSREFDGGIDLSGGQWQRVAIARAFMGNKSVLILDEPTSQLDPITESELYSEFADMSAGKTTILITHRLGATMTTDRIFVLSKGEISESGTHEELMNNRGLYSKMYDSQKKWYDRNEVNDNDR